MEKPNDNIQVGVIIFVYNKLFRGWISPEGILVKNPIKAQRMAEEMQRSLAIH